MNHFNRIIVMIFLVLKTLPLCPMDPAPGEQLIIDQEQKICYACDCYFFSIDTTQFIGWDDPCRHKLCNDCFINVIPQELFIKSGSRQQPFNSFKCPLCKDSFVMIRREKYDEGTNEYFIEKCCQAIGHSKRLMAALEFVEKKRSKNNLSSAELLKRASLKMNRPLYTIKGDDGNTLLNYGCVMRYNRNAICTIIDAAGNNAWTLINVPDNWKQTPLFHCIRNLCSYKDDTLLEIKLFLSFAPSTAAAWELINKKNYDNYTALMLVENKLNFMRQYTKHYEDENQYYWLEEALKLFESYRPLQEVF